ncbi:MAG: hypothetical protein WBF13_13030 [Candidatus Zixiibacteriota bacterium]
MVAVVEKCPNYIFHLMAVAEVGFSSEYAETYKHSVLPDDVSYIKRHGELMIFESGSCAELTFALVFFPSYINLKSADALEEYFSLLNSGLQTGDFQPFLKRYAPFAEKLNAWFPIEEQYLSSIKKHGEIIAGFGKTYLGNYPSYGDRVWVTEKPKLDEVASKVNDFLKDQNLIHKWEALTGVRFEFDSYSIVLCSAIKNGPNANSLGYDRTVFYHDIPIDRMIQLISHEVGTHILIDAYKEISSLGRFDPNALYGAYESLAMFYNTVILKNESLEYDMPGFRSQEFLEVYDAILSKNPNIGGRDLLVAGIEALRNQA